MSARRLILLGALIVIAFIAVSLWYIFAASDEGDDTAFAPYQHKVRIAVEDGNYPLSYYTMHSPAMLTGFDAELSRDLCKQMNLECEIVPLPFSEIIPALISDKVQMAFAGMSKTKERMRYLAYSNQYYYSRALFISGNRAIKNVELDNPDFLHKFKIGVKMGTIEEDFALNKYGDNSDNVYSFETYFQLRNALLKGRIDFALCENIAVHDIISNAPDAKFFEVTAQGVNLDEQGPGFITVAKKNSDDIAIINEALTELQENGVYQGLSQKYFSGNN